ncbi:mechanosensitive ion channel family protein [Halobacterium rubrum]|uniref:mechanosensitive ion channel family protein n=1 Tax=Halobacterium TaxID=2239 RepID=UPI001F23459F|nr:MULTISPECIES: mechanosensitive ion channel domain-containing protein [Halobacterium]MDH5020071.1 mechanosensitive ion channel [Halobacterium rubrum]
MREQLASLSAATTAEGPPDPGPEELVDLVPLAVNAAWFLLGFGVVVVLGWVVVEPLVGRVVRRRNRDNPTIQEAIARYVRVLFVLAGTAVGASVAGYGQLLSDSALVVAAGTLAVGVAAQTVVGSMVSGLVLVFDPEFSVGSYIEFGAYEGTVQSIQLRATRVETPGGELVTVPNTALTSEVVVRPYRQSSRRLVDRVNVDFDEALPEVLSHAADTAASLDRVVADPEPAAYVEELREDAVVVRVDYWVDSPRPGDLLETRSAFRAAVKSRLAAEGVSVSPPATRELGGSLTVHREAE